MDDAAIVALLAGIAPTVGEIPHPPFMVALPAGAVVEAGADLDAVDAWVKARGGWTHRTPAHLAGPTGERAPLFFIVPKGHLQAAGGASGAASPLGAVRGAAPGAFAARTGAGAVPLAGSSDGPRVSAPATGAPSVPAASGLATADVMAFVATADMAAARAFYGHGLGLRLLGQSPIACEFACNGTKLRVVAVEEPRIAPYTVLGWVVDDIAATIGDLGARGIDFMRYDGMRQDELGVWAAPGGALIAWFADPDGNVLSLTQF